MKNKTTGLTRELISVLNRAQELCVLNHEQDDDRLQDCLAELEKAMAKLGSKNPDLNNVIDAECE